MREGEREERWEGRGDMLTLYIFNQRTPLKASPVSSYRVT